MAHVLNDIFHDEITDLTRAVSKIAKGDDEVKISDKNVDRAVDLLALVRRYPKDVDEEYKSKVKTFEAKIAPFANERKVLKASAVALESRLVDGIMGLIKSGTISGNMRSKAGTTLSIVPRKMFSVKSADKIPDEFLLPREKCIDWAKVQEAYENDQEVSGVEVVEEFILRSKLPDVVED